MGAFRLPCGCGGQGRRGADAFDAAAGGDGFGGEGGEGEHAQQGHHEAGVFVGRQRQVAAAVEQALVVKLDLFAAELLCERGECGVFGIGSVGGLRHGLQQGNLQQQGGQIVQGAVEADGVGGHLAGFGDHGGAVARG